MCWTGASPSGARTRLRSFAVDCASGGGDGREFSTHGGSLLDPANGGHSLPTPDGHGCNGGDGMGPIAGIPRLPTWPAGVPGDNARLTAPPHLLSEVLHFEAVRVVARSKSYKLSSFNSSFHLR